MRLDAGNAVARLISCHIVQHTSQHGMVPEVGLLLPLPVLLLQLHQLVSFIQHSPNNPGGPPPHVRPQLAWSHRQQIVIVLLQHPADHCIYCLGAAQLVVPERHCLAR
eukprot:GHRQ01008618.1.p2 GENE.GHRQ01008618.1~~GHRQ01008618.1.p2  ORF type:complete len:108 (-),score=5.01 GHRQ01008618.1:469-792(-)